MLFGAGPIIKKVLTDEGIDIEKVKKLIPYNKLVRAINAKNWEMFQEHQNDWDKTYAGLEERSEAKWHDRMCDLTGQLLHLTKDPNNDEDYIDEIKRDVSFWLRENKRYEKA